jgi:hypothetical protein
MADLARDRGFESCSLHRRVSCEPDFLDQSAKRHAGRTLNLPLSIVKIRFWLPGRFVVAAYRATSWLSIQGGELLS